MRRSSRRRRARTSRKALDRDVIATAYGKVRTAHRQLKQGWETYQQALELIQKMRSNDPEIYRLLNQMRVIESGLYPTVGAVRDTMRRLGSF